MPTTAPIMMHVPVDRIDILDAPGSRSWVADKIDTEVQYCGSSEVEFTLRTPASNRTFQRKLKVIKVDPGPIDLSMGPEMVYIEVLVGNEIMRGWINFLINDRRSPKPFGVLWPKL